MDVNIQIYTYEKNMTLFTQTIEYALRAVVWLADHPDRSQTTQQIAAATRVPAGYLSKVLQNLGRGGLVRAQRGLHGGFMLTRSPEELTVLDVINVVDPIERIRECPLGLESHGTNLCPLHRKLDDALAAIEEAFGKSTIADLLETPSKSRPLCDVTIEGKPAAAASP